MTKLLKRQRQDKLLNSTILGWLLSASQDKETVTMPSKIIVSSEFMTIANLSGITTSMRCTSTMEARSDTASLPNALEYLPAAANIDPKPPR